MLDDIKQLLFISGCDDDTVASLEKKNYLLEIHNKIYLDEIILYPAVASNNPVWWVLLLVSFAVFQITEN